MELSITLTRSFEADKGSNHERSNVEDSSKHKASANVGVPEPQKNASATTGSSKDGRLNIQGPLKGRDPADASVTKSSDIGGQEVCTSFTGKKETDQKQLAPYVTRSTHDELLALRGFRDRRPRGHLLDVLLVQSR